MTEYPQRRKLPHGPPAWVEPGSLFFVTICGTPRHRNQFCNAEVADVIWESLNAYEEQGKWWIRLLLLMPDHMHTLMAIPANGSLKGVLTRWKHFLARQHGIRWQRDFFDHRLRRDESADQKAWYIRNNPVRAGLVAMADDWPYYWERP